MIYCYKDQDPLFLSINDHTPLALYGGWVSAAVIETSGEIVFVTNAIFASPTKLLNVVSLPKDDKAVKLACCNKCVIALGSSGKVYFSSFPRTGISQFKPIPELSEKIFVDIAGTYHHCFCITDTGKVYGYGNNSYCILDLLKSVKKIDKFKEITKLKKRKIVEVYAGYSHSIFKTNNGKIIACGWNYSGEALLNTKSNVVYPPAKVQIKGEIPFCITGGFTSIYYRGCEAPANMPNNKIKKPLFWIMKENM